MKAHTDGVGGELLSRPQNQDVYFRSGITWSDVTISNSSFRLLPVGFISDATGHSAYFRTSQDQYRVLAFSNTAIAQQLISAINPTVHFHIGYFNKLPLPTAHDESIRRIVDEAVTQAKEDWNSFETSWEFQRLPILRHKAALVQQSQTAADAECQERFARLKSLEEENNLLFIKSVGLEDEIRPEVADELITSYQPDRQEDTKRLLSYAIGCMTGRFSLDKPGIVYAHTGNLEFDPEQYAAFPADPDGILPLTEFDWGFPDDTAKRIEEFIGKVWPKQHLAENLKFVEDGLGTSIRKYLATGFYKDHLRWYKRRPIYWLFTSGKLRAFQCLVYLHRYHEGTLARMRTEYVNPLQSKIAARLDTLDGDIAQARGSLRTKLVREQDGLKKQQAELSAFDDKLKDAADRRIKLDLDDGVKANYGKFGNLVGDINLKAKVAYVADDFDESIAGITE